MDYQKIIAAGADTVVEGVRNCTLASIVDSGQCFRWRAVGGNRFFGIVDGRACEVEQQEDMLIFHGIPREEVEGLWLGYFDLERDYDAIKTRLLQDMVMREAVVYAPGMRVLRQPPWETLCSFILSANNNIPRIMGIVERLCALCGEPVQGGYAFPTPEALAALSAEALAPLRAGYRAPYLIDAAQKVAGGALDLDALYTLPLPEARKQLMRVKGIGPKVAECVLLYGFSRIECIPVDVWVKRALTTLYPEGFPADFHAIGGIAQQYLFHYVRCCPAALGAGRENNVE